MSLVVTQSSVLSAWRSTQIAKTLMKASTEPTTTSAFTVRRRPRLMAGDAIREPMKLEGIHHITAITADAQTNVDFYAGVMGLRLVKKTVNQDQPTVYHLFFADEKGSAGSDLTFFEFPGVPPGGRAPATCTGSSGGSPPEAARLLGEAPRRQRHRVAARGRGPRLLRPRGPRARAAAVVEVADEPLIADHPEVPGRGGAARLPRRPRLQRRARGQHAACSRRSSSSRSTAAGKRAATARGGLYLYDEPPAERALQGAGSVHHIAWASTIDEHEEWRERAIAGGARPTPVIDRFYFRSIYFREPSGVLFEIATLGPGFTVDEPLEHLGEKLSLPPDFEHLRPEVEPNLRPVVNPRRCRASEPLRLARRRAAPSSSATAAWPRRRRCSPSTASAPSSC